MRGGAATVQRARVLTVVVCINESAAPCGLPHCCASSQLPRALAFDPRHEVQMLSGASSTSLLDEILRATSPHDVLGLPASSVTSPAAIRYAFRKRALCVHPDKCEDERAEAAFKILADALECLTSDSVKPPRI